MCRVVVDRIRGHRADEADVIDDGADLREEFADLSLVASELGKLMLRAEAGELLALELGELLTFGETLRHGLAMHLGELGLGVECLQV